MSQRSIRDRVILHHDIGAMEIDLTSMHFASNEEVDALATQLMVTTDADEAEGIKRQIDALLWGDAYGATFFQSPGLVVHSEDVQGVEYMPNQTGVWWNFWEWSLNS